MKLPEPVQDLKGKSPRKKAKEESTPKKKEKRQLQSGKQEEVRKSKGNKRNIEKTSTPKKGEDHGQGEMPEENETMAVKTKDKKDAEAPGK